jgi:AraC-like DNA-binding protein
MIYLYIFAGVIVSCYVIWRFIVHKRQISKHKGVIDSKNDLATKTKVDYRSLICKHIETLSKIETVCDIELITETEITNQFIDSCTELIIKNISDPKYSVIRLSQDMCMDRSGFYKKIRKAAKCTPKVFIKNVRLNYAIGLLELKKYSYEEIAKMSGFESAVRLLLEYPSIFDKYTNDKQII